MNSAAAFTLVCLVALGGCAASQQQADRCAAGGGCVTLTREQLKGVFLQGAQAGVDAALEELKGCKPGGI